MGSTAHHAMKLSEETLKSGFAALDRDADNLLNKHDLAMAFESVGHEVDEKTIDLFMRGGNARVGTDMAQSLDIDTFSNILLKREFGKEDEKENMRIVCDAFEKAGATEGIVDADVLKAGFKRFGLDVTDEEAKELIRELDADGDRKLSRDEFMSLLH